MTNILRDFSFVNTCFATSKRYAWKIEELKPLNILVISIHLTQSIIQLMCSHEWETSGELLALDSVMTNIWNHFAHKPTKIPMTNKHNEVTSLDS